MLTKFAAEVVTEHHPLFKGLVWVAAARSTDETRRILTFVKIEKREDIWYIVATDGRRMHVHEYDPGLFDEDIDAPEPGLYEVVAKTAKLIVISEIDEEGYPDWRAIFDPPEPEHWRNLNVETLSRIGIDTGVLLAHKFAADALGFGCGRKKTEMVDVAYAPTGLEDRGPFYFQHDLGQAIVMPLRQSEDEDDEEGGDERDQTAEIEGLEEGEGDE